MLKPVAVRIDAATICQLKCPSCPTASRVIDSSVVGSGFLTLSKFQQFLEKNSFIKRVELSNWGEIFLNPEILSIFKYAHENEVELAITNGANLNNVRPEVLEAIVKFGIKKMVCSIDGATQAAYEMYRVKGNLDNVLKNIDAINRYKQQYESTFPQLIWQFIVFGHDEHEIEMARAMAQERDMRFKLKMNWDDLYDVPVSPPKDTQKVKEIFGAASRAEYLETFHQPYIWNVCEQLWDAPQINFDGQVLGCCINHWDSFGNAFDEDYIEIVNGERMSYARSMLTGEAAERQDIPCSSCKIYQQMKGQNTWIGEEKMSREREKAK